MLVKWVLVSSRWASSRYWSARCRSASEKDAVSNRLRLGQGLEIERRILGQFRHHDLGQELAHDVALERIVVEEDQRIEADVQGLLDKADIVGLVVPVGDEDGNILFLERHVGMLAERQDGVGVLVLADHGENDPAPFQFANELLEPDERLAFVELSQRDTLEPVVADDAAPKRVVEVEDDAFHDQARGGEHRVEQRLRQQRKMLEPAGRLRHVPHSRVKPLRPAYGGGEKIDVVQENVLGLARLDRQPVVDLGEN